VQQTHPHCGLISNHDEGILTTELRGKGADAMKSKLLWLALMTLTALSLTNRSLVAQQSGVARPMVLSAQVPFYPPLARVANVDGTVHVKVTTDGHRVVSTQVEDGNKLLAAAAEENAKTWQFRLHESATFTVTYTYKLLTKWKGDPDNPTVVLRFPTEVEVSTMHRQMPD
jgi:hypothetical protein